MNLVASHIASILAAADDTAKCADNTLELPSGTFRFRLQYQSRASADQVAAAARTLRQRQDAEPDCIFILVVPYMGEVGKKLCAAQGIHWLDLSGNAHIITPSLIINIAGKPNLYKHAGRPAQFFSAASVRIARALLLWPDHWFMQGDLADEIGINRGGMSGLIRRYEEAGFVERRTEGRRNFLRARNSDMLLDAWREADDFSKHDIHRGHIPARSGPELLEKLATTFERENIDYAATGLAAAWLLEPFAQFRLVTLYLSQWPSAEIMEQLMFRETSSGANVWLTLPKDDGVYFGSEHSQSIKHVSAVQTYIDLKAQPERAEEAAEALRRAKLQWSEQNE